MSQELEKNLTQAVGEPRRIQGRIFFDNGVPAAGLSVRVYNREVGCSATKLGETKTGGDGLYTLSYALTGDSANLEVRVVDIKDKEVSLSATKFDARSREVMNLVAPVSVRPLDTEYQRIKAGVHGRLGERGKLADTRETRDCPDLSLLSRATGWDARLIALLAIATKLSAELAIPEEALYGVFRAGLPTDKQLLAQVTLAAVEKALRRSTERRIIGLSDQQIKAGMAAFRKLGRKGRPAAKTPGGLSTFGELLKESDLTTKEKGIFEDLYFTDRGTGAGLWAEARKQGIPEAKINRLQLQGRLAYLTLNNAVLAQTLQKEIGKSEGLAQLVDNDLHEPGEWKKRLRAMAGNKDKALQKLIPPAYTGEKTADRLDAYAADLARKVRLSFPTSVVRRMIEKDELQIGKGKKKGKGFADAFLRNAEGLGFKLGREALGSFIKKHKKEVFQGIDPADVEETTESLKAIQRLYQITPSDEALKVVADLGFTSAYDIVAFPYDVFIERFGDKFAADKVSSIEVASLVYRKAQQVSSVTYNFFAIAKQMDTTPVLYAISPPAGALEDAKNNLIEHFPTMESLFGSLDFCECEHCRSVLSPAAYLVDLLQFLDPDDQVWDSFLTDWKTKHNGEDYTLQHKKAYDALMERRPDLPSLPLTCENTNTALPYIDIVNEILEYYVANGKLEPGAVHDTGQATSIELLAEPQNILAEAYDKLRETHYPLGLPFDLWLETVRRFCDHFETPLWRVLEVFGAGEELFPPNVNPAPYYRAAIFAEYLAISPAEYTIFTDADPKATWHELYGFDDPAKTAAQNQADAMAALKSAKTLARQLGLSYKEVIGLVRTAFVNPRLDALVVLRRLAVDVDDVFRYKGHPGYPPFSQEETNAFEQRLADLSGTFEGFDASAWLEIAWQNGDFNQILVLADPGTGCNFDLTVLRNADGTAADPLVFIRLNLFVRLWKKLGWSIDETDRALQVFLPASALPLTEANIGEAMKSALIYLAHLKSLEEKVKVGAERRLKLLTLWSPLTTTGDSPLYARLFLTPSILKNDPVFDDPLGNYLSQTGILLKEHMLAIQGALNLTADDARRALADAGGDFETAELSLDNVSVLYRYGLLAKALKLSIPDVIALKALSGLDPFKQVSAQPLTVIDQDYPLTQTVRFIEVAASVKESGFEIEDLSYILRHAFDPVGKYRPDADVFLGFVRSLAAGIARIQSENQVPADAAAVTDDLLRDKLALVLPPGVVETFLGFWKDTLEFSAVKKNVAPNQKLAPAKYEVDGIRVSYEATTQWQRVSHVGVLTDAEKTAILSKTPAPDAADPQGEQDAYANFTALLDEIAASSQPQPQAFFEKEFEGFLVYDDLFGAPAIGLTADEKRQKVLAAFLPFLQQKLARKLVVDSLVAALSADPMILEALLTEGDLVADPGAPVPPGQPGKPLLDSFVAGSKYGVSAEFFVSSDLSGPSSGPAQMVSTVDLTSAPAGTNSARFKGYLEVSRGGPYRFYAALGKTDAETEFRLSALTDPLIRYKAVKDDDEFSDFIELRPATPYEFTVEARNLQGGTFALLVKGETSPKDRLGSLLLYSSAAVERIRRANTLLSKILQLIKGLELSEREVRHLLTHTADFNGLDFSKLPTREDDDSPAGATALFGQFLRLADYSSLKRELAGGADDLIGIFETARRSLPLSAIPAEAEETLIKDLCKRVADLTRRDVDTIKTTAAHLGLSADSAPASGSLEVEAPGFTQEKGVRRLWEALQIVEQFGVPVDAIVRATGIIGTAQTPAERFNIARDLRNTVKARYEPETWQRIAQPIFDKLRRRQRDALAAHIMHRLGFERMEQLFEYFLIDPGMEPVVQTSRLRLAISSVQTFIQRCLLNLEPEVHPSTINSNHWQWMKRYRVWEANRKIFLFPENWLEPEFRDDKTHLFAELEGTLLQTDVSNDLAEDAFFNYLKKLEQLARLDIVAMYCEEKPLDPASNTIHVIGRTYSLPHKYFYRRYVHRMWTPWEPVGADIEGDHLTAIVWRERLHLFWVTFLEKAKKNTDGNPIQVNLNQGIEVPTTPQRQIEMQLNWSEYFQGEWTTRESGGFADPIRVEVPNNFNSREVFIWASKEYEGGEEREVKINFSGEMNIQGYGKKGQFTGPNQWKTAFKVESKQSAPEVIVRDPAQPFSPPYTNNRAEVSRYLGSNALEVSFVERIETEQGKRPVPKSVTKAILRKGGGFSLLVGDNPLELVNPELAPLIRPFFYQDNRNTFYVEPTLVETTLEQWDDWMIPVPRPDYDDWWDDMPLEAGVPFPKGPFPGDPGDLFEIDPLANYAIDYKTDWLTDSSTILQFDDNLVQRSGGLDMHGGQIGGGAMQPGGGLGSGSVIAGGGLNQTFMKSFNGKKGL